MRKWGWFQYQDTMYRNPINHTDIFIDFPRRKKLYLQAERWKVASRRGCQRFSDIHSFR